tara:strand:- start:149 stop:553 length:405 start_codon:yes stop_codon:yes gene_type:complete
MVGLIWLIQLVHYPLFNYVGSEEFIVFHDNHKILITPVVGTVMIVELVTSVIILFQPHCGIRNWLSIVGIILLGIIWSSTIFFQIPIHNTLSSKFNENALIMLINTNWIRTICWSVRGIILLLVLDKLLKNRNN